MAEGRGEPERSCFRRREEKRKRGGERGSFFFIFIYGVFAIFFAKGRD